MMTLKDKLLAELEKARTDYLRLLESIPESEYSRPSGNEAWNRVGFREGVRSRGKDGWE